jgi:hypothetical protein
MLLYHPRARRSASPTSRRVRLLVEQLEDRNCPSCTITSFNATPTTGTTVQLTGQVSDPNPTSVQITFSGQMSGTASVNPDGSFSFTGQANNLGAVYAQGVDGVKDMSNQATAYISATAPTVSNVAISYGPQRQVTITGNVQDESPSMCTVYFSGSVGGYVNTNQDGSFSYTTIANSLGSVSLWAVDPWGLVGPMSYTKVTDTTPAITSFTAVNTYGNYWTLSGTVQAQSVSGLTVYLGGLSSAQGVYATVNANGTFSVLVQFQPGEAGTVSANLTDWWGEAAATVYTTIS